jgi:hypothetical protein
MTVHSPAYVRSILAGVAAWLVSIVLLHWLPLPIPIEGQFSHGELSWLWFAIYDDATPSCPT